MYLSQNEDEGGYKATELLPISAGKGRNFETKLWTQVDRKKWTGS